GYNLSGLTEHRCPECGRPFDPANHRTFCRTPPSAARRYLRGFITLTLFLALLSAPGLIWLHHGWKREQSALGTLRTLGGTWSTRSLLPRWPTRILTRYVGPISERVTAVDLSKSVRRLDEYSMLQTLPWLEDLSVGSLAVNSDLSLFATLSGLRKLQLNDSRIADLGLQQLKQPHLVVRRFGITVLDNAARTAVRKDLRRLKQSLPNGADVAASPDVQLNIDYLEARLAAWDFVDALLQGDVPAALAASYTETEAQR